MLHTLITRNWGLRFPILGAPMAGSGRGRLANAVTAAGGLGMIGIGSRDPVDMIERESAIARGSGKFGIGLMAWAIELRPDLLDVAIAQQPFLLSISFGPIKPFIDRVKHAGILLTTQVNHRRAALDAAHAGADLIVAQGTEAGGHTGFVSTLPLLQIVLESVDTPVAAAGGIGSPAGLAAVLMAGAQAGWIGTAFLLSLESEVTETAKERIAAADEASTIHTTVFDRVNRLEWPSEYPGRALQNRFTDAWHGREDELLAQSEEIARFRQGAIARDYDVTSIYAGQTVGMLSEKRGAAEIVEWLGVGAERIIAARSIELLGR